MYIYINKFSLLILVFLCLPGQMSIYKNPNTRKLANWNYALTKVLGKQNP